MHVDGRKELIEFDQSFSSFYNDCKTSSKQKKFPWQAGYNYTGTESWEANISVSVKVKVIIQ